jgi:hypothetical protein
MTRAHKIEVWIAVLVALGLTASTIAIVRWQRQKPLSLRGAVLVADSDPRKQQPIAGVEISGGDLAAADVKSDSSGLFVLKLHKRVRKGHPIVLSFRSPHYRPLDLNDYVANKIYVVHLVPVASPSVPQSPAKVKVSNVRVMYSSKAMTELNVGSAVKIFEIENKGDVPCKNQNPCSPDGKWKAAAGAVTLDAGSGNEFRNARASCIAGPCPFTKIEATQFSQGGQKMTVSALNWSDTATFLIEAEVFRMMISQREHWSYPVIFGEGLSFTLPSGSEGVSIEADLNGQTIIFPLGPSISLSWATCDMVGSPDKSPVYRCTAKPEYSFQ